MAGFTFGGLATGLDTNTIIEQLVLLESRPLARLENRRQSFVDKQSQFSQFKSKLSALNDAIKDLSRSSELSLYETNSSDETIARVEAGSGATSGNFELEVTSLARARSVYFATAFSDADTADVGAGQVDFTVDGVSSSVTIDNGDTLNDVRDKINDADLGVQASIVNDGTGYNLVFTAEETGVENSFTVDQINFANAGGLSEVELIAAEDAQFSINNLAITSSTNQIEDAIEGLTINLESAAPGQSVEISVTRDDDAIAEKLDDFISSYNDVLDYIDAQDDRNDISLRGIKRSLQNAFRESFDSGDGFAFEGLSQIGIETNATGRAELNREVLDEALSQDFSGFQDFFGGIDGGEDGLAGVFDNVLNGDTLAGTSGILSAATGTLALRQKSLGDRIRGLDSRIERQEARLVKYEERQTLKFAALEQLTAQLQAQGAALGGF
ncbi:MAG: flagellar filament capping protein FliD [Planctomycetota bacterium]